MNVRKVKYSATSTPSEFTRSLKETGFGVLTHHPIPIDLVMKVYSEWEIFFHSQSKIDYLYDPVKQDGFFPFQTEMQKAIQPKISKNFIMSIPGEKYLQK